MPDVSTMHCGPAGFSHPAWESALYPGSKPRNFHSLLPIAERFDAVEIGSTFDESLKPELALVWLRKIENNPRFQFTFKLHRRFTHDRVLTKKPIEEFKSGLYPLHEARRLGCVLMQFPWSFRYTKENRDHLIRLRRTFHEFPLVAEMRHASWMLDEALGTFIDYRIGFCNIDQPAYTKAMPPTSFLTSTVGYVRLHGRNCFNWFGAAERDNRKPRYDYLYSETELADWVRRIDRIRGYARRTFVIANNGSDGKSVLTALQMQALLDGREPSLSTPRELVSLCRKGRQGPLFTEYNARAVA